MAQPTATLRASGDIMSCPSYGERVEMQPGTMSRSGAKENQKVQPVNNAKRGGGDTCLLFWSIRGVQK